MADVTPLTIESKPGNMIRHARRFSGLKRAELAARVGATKSDIRTWEAGEGEVPVAQAAALSELFGIKVPALFGHVDWAAELDRLRGRWN